MDCGMDQPENVTAFLATGALSDTDAIPYNYAGLWFLGWRCLYAEIVHSRVEQVPIDLKKALTRWTAMVISRLKSYGYYWRTWVNQGIHKKHIRIIPRKHRDKGVLQQEADGEYDIATPLWNLAKELGISS